MKQTFPLPINEKVRLDALKSYNIMDTEPEEQFDNLTRLAAEICDVPICLISLLDEDRQWFKSKVGLAVDHTPRNISFCQYAIMDNGTMEIQNALEDERFKNHVLVTEDPSIRFYAGQPLIDENGFALGTLCVIDQKPKKLAQNQINALKILAKEVVLAIASRKEKLDLEQANKKIKALQEVSKIELEAINDAVIRIELSPKGKILNINENFTKVFGYESDFIGMNHNVLLFDETDEGLNYKTLWKNLNANIPQTAEFKRKGRNGNAIWIKGTYMPIQNDQGEVVKILKLAYDITNSKQLSEDLFYLNKFNQGILDATPQAIISTDKDGLITSFNKGAEKMLGYTALELVGKQNPGLLHVPGEVVKRATDLTLELKEEIEPGFEAFIAKTRKTGTPDDNNWTYVRKDGTELPVWLSINSVRNEQNEIVGYIGISFDLTEQQEYVLEIQKKNQELDQFSYIVSHDLKAPLRAISTLTTFLEEDLEGKLDKDTQANFEMLKSRAKRMDGLINGILAYSKIGRIEALPDTFLSNDAIDEVLAGLEIKPNFEVNIEENLPEINFNRVQFQQVMQNLIGNGLKYHDKSKGSIKVSYKDLGASHEFSVTDDGPGIGAQYHDRIFGIFQTLQSRDDIESTGVGLSIVKKIIEGHNGTIRIDSELGKGSTFIFTIPK